MGNMNTFYSSETERYLELKDRILTVVPWDRTKEITIRELNKTISQSLLSYAKELELVGSSFHMEKIAEPLLFNKRVVGESIAAMCRQRADLLNLAKLFTVLPEVLSNAILLEVEEFRHSNLNKAKLIAGVYQYISAFCDEEVLYPVKITVEQYRKVQKSKIHVVITVGRISLEVLKKEEALPNVGVHPSETDGESLTAGVASFNINIQHLVKLFNRNESVILKNFPDEMLSDKQREIKTEVKKSDLAHEEIINEIIKKKRNDR
jgi:hypothetical protein